MRTTARGTSGAVDGAPPARSSGTSTSTVPAMCTSGVRVVLLLDEEERDAPVAVVRNEQQADEDRGDDEPPDNTDADEADGCGLVPNNLLWI